MSYVSAYPRTHKVVIASVRCFLISSLDLYMYNLHQFTGFAAQSYSSFTLRPLSLSRKLPLERVLLLRPKYPPPDVDSLLSRPPPMQKRMVLIKKQAKALQVKAYAYVPSFASCPFLRKASRPLTVQALWDS